MRLLADAGAKWSPFWAPLCCSSRGDYFVVGFVCGVEGFKVREEGFHDVDAWSAGEVMVEFILECVQCFGILEVEFCAVIDGDVLSDGGG